MSDLRTPFEIKMNTIEWVPVPGMIPENIDQHIDLPFATHRGILRIEDIEMEVFRLSNGQAVITEEGMFKFCEWLRGQEL